MGAPEDCPTTSVLWCSWNGPHLRSWLPITLVLWPLLRALPPAVPSVRDDRRRLEHPNNINEDCGALNQGWWEVPLWQDPDLLSCWSGSLFGTDSEWREKTIDCARASTYSTFHIYPEVQTTATSSPRTTTIRSWLDCTTKSQRNETNKSSHHYPTVLSWMVVALSIPCHSTDHSGNTDTSTGTSGSTEVQSITWQLQGHTNSTIMSRLFGTTSI